ncbi:hypothetical protein EUX98_g9220 [Antrodiella citrinella]|uniref:DUF6589 domain-containing protein n=1 Tax=Antrodiella citrinella TaxID=2447956 RepID=A0A4S4LWH7_9APHY|nr:hypothetical protein EUX98_g9220 [Antrodiella citrinella]
MYDGFQDQATQNNLPPIEELEAAALQLYRAYSSVRATERALYDVSDQLGPTQVPKSAWEQTVPLGSPWVPPSTENSADPSMSSGKTTAKAQDGKKKKRKHIDELPEEEPFKGDRALAQSIAFMRDAVVAREFVYAMAEGDVGRMYEALKPMVFTFAGSPHSKYTGFLLEFICDLELESSPELKAAKLNSLVVNLTGMPGRFLAKDFVQERGNKVQAHIGERKGREYSDTFMRRVTSRNLQHFATVLDDVRADCGLKKRPGRHHKPHTRPELLKLDRELRTQQLHSRRPGRTYDTNESARDVDNHRAGVSRLRQTRLASWIQETTHLRNLCHSGSHNEGLNTALHELEESIEATEQEDEEDDAEKLLGSVYMEDESIEGYEDLGMDGSENELGDAEDNEDSDSD